MNAHGRYLRLVRAHFAEEIDEPRRQELFAHLRRCDDCRAEFDRAATLLRLAADREPTHQELERWEQQVRTRIQPDAPRRASSGAGLRSWLAAAAAAALVFVLTFAVWIGRGPTPPHARPGPGLQLRGGDGVRPLVGLEIFAVSTRETPARPRRVADRGTVRLEEYLQFRYRNHSMRVAHLYLVGMDDEGVLLDYFPRPDEETSVSIDEALGPVAVPRSIRLAKRHHGGPLWIYGIFSERPLTRSVVHDRLKRLADAGNIGADPGLGQGVFVTVKRIEVVDEAAP